MPITKRSRRPSPQFDSRFRTGAGVDFPLRQYLRCREDFISGIVQGVLLAAFAVTLALFGRTLDNLFAVHGAHLNPWFRRLALAALVVFLLSVVRRLVYKVRELRQTRAEMSELKREFRNSQNWTE